MRAFGMLIFGVMVALLLRSTALSAFAARGIVLDVLAFAVIVWALRYGAVWGATFGFVLGLLADLDATHWLGRHTLILSLIGYVVGLLARTLVRESSRTQFVLLVLATAAHQAWVVAFELGGLDGLLTGWPYLLQRVVVGAFASGAVGTLVFMVVRRLVGRPLFGHAIGQPS